MSGMEALIAFWRDRLDEAEAAARAATPGNWQAGPEDDHSAAGFYAIEIVVLEDPGAAVAELLGGPYEGDCTRADAAHIARHDPASVLRDIAADRAILDMLEEQPGRDLPDGISDGRDPDEQEADEAARQTLEQVARIRAARFASHPAYRQEWAP
jgi:hypothetical protein